MGMQSQDSVPKLVEFRLICNTKAKDGLAPIYRPQNSKKLKAFLPVIFVRWPSFITLLKWFLETINFCGLIPLL